MVWIGERRGHAVDWVTQRWVQITGRRLALSSAPWLSGPCGAAGGIGADFFERWGDRHGLTVLPPRPDDGLLDGLATLAGPTFDPASVHAAVDEFYAHTAAFHLTIDSRWSGPFAPPRPGRSGESAPAGLPGPSIYRGSEYSLRQ